MDHNPFDVTTKELVWDGPAAWLERIGIGPPGPAEVIDSDITTLTAAADKVIKVAGPEPYLVNIELQSSHDKDLVETTWFRQAALCHRHKLPVLSVLVLLRREANSPSFTGSFEIRMRDGWQTNQYNYKVVRMWEEDPEPYLTSGINLVPLAPITNVAEDELPGLVKRMAERITIEPQPSAAKLWTAAYLLMGLRYSKEVASHLLEGVRDMQESTTYQAILKEGLREGLVKGRQEGRVEGRQEGIVEGRIAGERRLLVRQGTKKFGQPDPETVAVIEAIQDVERLEALGLRIVDPDVRDWSGLLQTS